jgi:hypothetical protein
MLTRPPLLLLFPLVTKSLAKYAQGSFIVIIVAKDESSSLKLKSLSPCAWIRFFSSMARHEIPAEEEDDEEEELATASSSAVVVAVAAEVVVGGVGEEEEEEEEEDAINDDTDDDVTDDSDETEEELDDKANASFLSNAITLACSSDGAQSKCDATTSTSVS